MNFYFVFPFISLVDKFRYKYCKLLGSYFRASPKLLIYLILNPLLAKFRLKYFKLFVGSYLKIFYKIVKFISESFRPQ